MVTNASLTGIIHGKTIELEQETGMADGTRVQVAVISRSNVSPSEGLRRAFGSWSDDPQGVEEFLKQVRRDRDNDPR